MIKPPLNTKCGLILALFMLAACGVNSAQRNNAGNSDYENGRFEEALRDYQAAQVAAPDRAEAYYNAGIALAELGEIDRAIVNLNQALKTADSALSAQGYYNLGNVYMQGHMCTEAVSAYQEALLINSNDTDARHNLELAQFCASLTPPPLEQQTEPQIGETDQDATPTPNPGNTDPPTSTPPPDSSEPDPTQPPENDGEQPGGIPTTPSPVPEGPLSIDDARRLLDAAQQDQRTLREFLQSPVLAPAPQSGKDW